MISNGRAMGRKEEGITPRSRGRIGGWLHRVGAAAVVLGLVLTGCARDAAYVPSSDDPKFAQTVLADDATTGSLVGGVVFGGGLGSPVVVNTLILPQLGGVITNGRYTLIVPPGALSAPTVFTVQDNRNGYIEVELGPHGSVFNLPVTLVVSLAGTNADRNTKLYWWDESNGMWVNMGGSTNPLTRTLTVPLPHFSKYRAGW